MVESVLSKQYQKTNLYNLLEKEKEEHMKTTLLESILATHSKKSGVLSTRLNNPNCRNLFYGNSHMYQDVHHHIIC